VNLAGVRQLMSIVDVVERLRPLAQDSALAVTRVAVVSRTRSIGSVTCWGCNGDGFKDYYAALGVAKTATERR